MVNLKREPIRRGRPICFTLDEDATALLRAMVPHAKGIGRLVSEMIRREARERAERPQLLATLRGHHTQEAMLDEVTRAVG